jgi:hypothetical protein
MAAAASRWRIFDNELHTLPKLGRFAKENEVPMPRTGKRTVILPLEDGPAGTESQLYMYVGHKEKRGSVLSRNGLDNGKLYVLKLSDHATEGDFTSGTARGRWVEIPGAAGMTETELEAASDEAGAFGFVRIEDGAASKTSRSDFYFVSTGGSPENTLGRAYRLRFDREKPTGKAKLSVVYNADAIVAAGGDTAISPDNVDTSKRYLMVNEDGTSESRPVMASRGRDGSVWRFDLQHGYARQRVAELNPPGRDGVAVGAGVWETTGIVDASSAIGSDSWLLNVQAHSPTTAPAPGTVEDGQLLLMGPAG